MESTRTVGGKLLRRGVTTGACAAAAAKAAAIVLLGGGGVPASVRIQAPGGTRLALEIADAHRGAGRARCAVRKSAGDDPDITDGVLVYANVEKTARGVVIDGGEGVGRVTKPGLDQPPGQAAINSVPRRMIACALLEAAAMHGYGGGFSAVISIPGGEELAKRTFNPRLGIEGGLSVLGTTGIVEPMSHKAIADTIRVELRQLTALGAGEVLITPGNYGAAFAQGALRLSMKSHINCSNCIGEALGAAAELGFRKILLIGHVGKLVKLGIGLINTHSAFGDGRLETLTAAALRAGAPPPVLNSVLGSATTDAALAVLHGAGLLEKAMCELGRRMEDCLARQVPNDIELGYICFTNAAPMAGILAQSGNAEELMKIWRMP